MYCSVLEQSLFDQGPYAQAIFGPSNMDMADSLHYNSRLRYLMAVCRDGTTREQLESLAPDFPALKKCCQDSGIFAVMVTAAGAAVKRCPMHILPMVLLRSAGSRESNGVPLRENRTSLSTDRQKAGTLFPCALPIHRGNVSHLRPGSGAHDHGLPRW